MIRLGFQERIADLIDIKNSLPAVGQGIVGIECRVNDEEVKPLLSVLNDRDAEICITAERRMNQCLDGGCSVPIAGFAQLNEGVLIMKGVVGNVRNGDLLIAEAQGELSEAAKIGELVAQDLLSQGAAEFIAESTKTE